MQKIENWLYLNAIPSLPPAKTEVLLDKLGSPEAVFRESTESLQKIAGLGPEIATRIKQKEKWLDLDEELALSKKLNCQIITLQSPQYPSLLKNVSSPPILLYVKGKLPEENHNIAMVGTRRASYYGKEMAEKLSGELAERGVTIVSGMARGIDTWAHRGCLKKKGGTLAVLGSGLKVIYPPENRNLAEEIASSGALISEYPLNTAPDKWNFPRRNRIISGLSLGVVVVEAGKSSGASITANFALEQGREVFALPGKVDSKTSEGTHRLIQDGAKLVTNWKDILVEVLPQAVSQSEEKEEKKQKTLFPALDRTEQLIYQLLTSEPQNIEKLIEKSNLPSSMTLSLLMALEIKGLVKQLPGKFFVKVP